MADRFAVLHAFSPSAAVDHWEAARDAGADPDYVQARIAEAVADGPAMTVASLWPTREAAEEEAARLTGEYCRPGVSWQAVRCDIKPLS